MAITLLRRLDKYTSSGLLKITKQRRFGFRYDDVSTTNVTKALVVQVRNTRKRGVEPIFIPRQPPRHAYVFITLRKNLSLSGSQARLIN